MDKGIRTIFLLVILLWNRSYTYSQNMDTRLLLHINSAQTRYDPFWKGVSKSALPLVAATPLSCVKPIVQFFTWPKGATLPAITIWLCCKTCWRPMLSAPATWPMATALAATKFAPKIMSLNRRTGCFGLYFPFVTISTAAVSRHAGRTYQGV